MTHIQLVYFKLEMIIESNGFTENLLLSLNYLFLRSNEKFFRKIKVSVSPDLRQG